MRKLEQMVHISKTLDQRLEDKANELDATDPAKSKAIRETALFYVRQRHQDLLTQMAVTVQGYLALDLVKKNNVELVKGVDRASTTTVSALRTAVTVAQAMANQKLVLEQITQLNTTTANIIDSTGTLLKQNTARIHEQASSATIPLWVASQSPGMARCLARSNERGLGACSGSSSWTRHSNRLMVAVRGATRSSRRSTRSSSSRDTSS